VEAGFSNSSGYWICPNGQELRQIYVAALAESPTHAAFCEELVERWNNFFGKRSDGSDYFVLEIHADFSGWLLITFGNRDFDIVYYSGLWIGMPPSHFPLYFYYYFHVENDRSPWGWNIFGFNDSVLNDLTWKLKFGRDPNTGRLLSLYELRQVCFKAQQIIEDEVPLIPLLVRGRFTAFRPELAGWNFEFDQRWLYVLTNWENLSAGGGLNWLIDYISEKWSLHPLTLHRKYQPDTYLFDAVFDPLIVFDPYSGEEMAWAAIDWRRELWSDVALNVSNGMKVTFWLRDDMYWHDGVPISAEDVKFCWEYLKRYDAPIFKDVASKLVRVETEGDYAVHAYLNSTSYALIYDLADTALLLPKHLWENVTDPLTFKPWKHIHPLFNGSRKSWPGWWSYDWPLTLYVGSGPFIFHKWNSTAKPEYIHVVRNPHYWVTCPVVSGIAAKPYTLVGSPVNFTVALTSVLDENTTVELSIYVDDVLWDKVNVALEPFGHERFGPYTIEGLSPGIHTIKTAHTESTTGMSFNYTQKLTVTIPEDLNRDLHVDMQDIFIAANSFGAYPNHPRWSPQADINKDNYVGIDDIYLIAKKFGWTAKENQ
jgi:ABC-type transport system substrate-binding protein